MTQIHTLKKNIRRSFSIPSVENAKVERSCFYQQLAFNVCFCSGAVVNSAVRSATWPSFTAVSVYCTMRITTSLFKIIPACFVLPRSLPKMSSRLLLSRLLASRAPLASSSSSTAANSTAVQTAAFSSQGGGNSNSGGGGGNGERAGMRALAAGAASLGLVRKEQMKFFSGKLNAFFTCVIAMHVAVVGGGCYFY